jgi:hypothetical protein
LGFKDREVALWVRRERRSRRITLSLDPTEGGTFRLSLPARVPLSEGLAFAEEKRRWILQQLDGLPPRIPFAPGETVPVLGQPHVIVHDPAARRGVWRDAGVIRVSGFAEHVPRRVRDFLKREARATLTERAHDKAGRLDRPIARISLRDTRSRWGSCSSDGGLSFSWRLILAPEEVLDYVVAHEVAHLMHHDHGAKFWALVTDLTPSVDAPRRWLRAHGPELHRYG